LFGSEAYQHLVQLYLKRYNKGKKAKSNTYTKEGTTSRYTHKAAADRSIQGYAANIWGERGWKAR
jgi:hypothetical protein